MDKHQRLLQRIASQFTTPRETRRLTTVIVLFLILNVTHTVKADDASRVADKALLILKSRCVSCHGADKQDGELRLDSAAAALIGGDRGPAVVPGDLTKSRLVEAIRFTNPDLQMPPKSKLSDQDIRTIEQWIAAGADWPESSTPTNVSSNDAHPSAGDAFGDIDNPVRKIFHGDRLDLWSLKRPQMGPRLESGTNLTLDEREIRLSPAMIDQLVLQRLHDAGLERSPEADRRTLLRRLKFDLTGLPPTPEELRSFAADSSPEAYETLVDRLLDSPRYGERWARHWLDVVRYADTEGFERDEFRPKIWQYRDYVIRSFNRDKPFDQFIREQLAGDELLNGPPQNQDEADRLIATGFLRLGQWDSTAAIFQEEARHRDQQLADLANTTGSAFLGLTFSCCQCHDHKYDPLLQADHFRLRAFFAGVSPRNDLVIELAEDQAIIAKHNQELDEALAPLKEEQSKLDKEKEQDRPRLEELNASIAEIEANKKSARTTMGATDSGAEAPATHLFYQGDFSQPREEVSPGFVSVFDPGPAVVTPPRADTTGRRLALANWITSDENPWTARVFVNRVWQHHFGVGLVATANDFGFSGARPSHPELLDALALAFVKEGWSIKKLHRAIVCSATYRQQSNTKPASKHLALQPVGLSKDPTNVLLWRQNIVRLDAETLRDSLLAISGALQPLDSGRPLWPHVPVELLHAQPGILEAKDGGDGGRMQGWYEDPVDQTDVRSIFLVRKRAMPIPFLQAFDLPDSTVSCARRDTTVVAPQALMLLNSPESVRFAQLFAERIIRDAGSTAEERIEALFQLAVIRSPDPEELSLCREMLDRHEAQYRADRPEDLATLSALRDLCRAVMNLNEFAYID